MPPLESAGASAGFRFQVSGFRWRSALSVIGPIGHIRPILFAPEKNPRRNFPSGIFPQPRLFSVKKIFAHAPPAARAGVFRGENNFADKIFPEKPKRAVVIGLSNKKVTENLQKRPEF